MIRFPRLHFCAFIGASIGDIPARGMLRLARFFPSPRSPASLRVLVRGRVGVVARLQDSRRLPVIGFAYDHHERSLEREIRNEANSQNGCETDAAQSVRSGRRGLRGR